MNLEALNEIYTPEVRTSLARYMEHLEDTVVKLKEREEQAKRRLQTYESAGTGMEEIAKRFAELTKEAESVRADIKRLGGEV